METSNKWIKSSDGKTDLYIKYWMPNKKIKAILQITHGMLEYIDRYNEFAQFLVNEGYLVVGQDILGHGESVVDYSKRGFFAKENGNQILLDDMKKIMEDTKNKYPNLPYFHLGHSMGSYLLRQFLTVYSEQFSGAIIVGTGMPPKIVLKFGMFLTNLMRKIKGEMYRSKFIDDISIGSFNNHYDNPKTKVDWISRDEKIVKDYVNDEKINYIFTVNAYYNMYKSISSLYDYDKLAKISKTIPIILLSGEKDPVGEFTKGVEKTYEMLKNVGLLNIEKKYYQGARHEIINEINRKEVYVDILDWLDRKVDNID
jgi:alpha-beta hydrolase superfamily lysophospholipase